MKAGTGVSDVYKDTTPTCGSAWCPSLSETCKTLRKIKLLDFYLCACFFKSLLDLRSFVLAYVLFYYTKTFNEILGFLETEASDDSSDGLDDVNLLFACIDELDCEFGLLFSGFACSSRGSANSSNSYRRGSGYTELLFHSFYELGNFEY